MSSGDPYYNPSRGVQTSVASTRYQEVFAVEIEGWCYGISQYPGEIFPALIFSIIKELAPSFHQAIVCGVEVDVLDIAMKLSRAAKYLVDEQEIGMRVFLLLPNLAELPVHSQNVLEKIIQKVDTTYPGAASLLEEKWAQSQKGISSF
jgi:hypothetical protein